MKPTLKLTLFIAFISLFSPERSYAIVERDTIPAIQKVTRTPEESMKSEAKSSLGVGLVFLIPTTLLTLTFKGISKAVVLSLIKGAAAASLGISLICFTAFFIFLKKLKKKNFTINRFKFWERLSVVVILCIGLISLLPLFYLSLPTLVSSFLLKTLNLFSGLLFSALGITFLFKKKYQS